MEENTIDLIMTYVTSYSFKILGSFVIFFVGKWLVRIIVSIIIKLMSKSSLDKTLANFLSKVIKSVLFVIVVLAALNNLGVDTTSFVALFGAAGLAIGLAFKDTFSNIGAGVLIIFFRPFKVGDYISAAGEMGTVEAINIFSTLLVTPDNKQIIIPNGGIIDGNITNFSAKSIRRVDFVFGIGYDDDLKLAKSTLEEIVNADKRVLKDPAPFVAVGELADSSVNFTVKVWAKSEDYWGIHFDTIEKVKLTFDEKGISIPYPQMDIHTKN
ncbi:MAG TPA: mechanosensitive ion channel [Sulfurospirillum arcachonense]|nr:mechanosensitive ion channel [Campylobacterales bacterium]HIP45148.1 mechanosensitive ion channel [Sulfurospirillum arcachonense]